MRLSELAALVHGDPEVMVESPDGHPIPVAAADLGAVSVPGVGVVQCLILQARDNEEEEQ